MFANSAKAIVAKNTGSVGTGEESSFATIREKEVSLSDALRKEFSFSDDARSLSNGQRCMSNNRVLLFIVFQKHSFENLEASSTFEGTSE